MLVTVADQALRDPLTGLANRALFNERLDHAMELRARDGSTVSVVAVDLNDFKLVNDSRVIQSGTSCSSVWPAAC